MIGLWSNVSQTYYAVFEVSVGESIGETIARVVGSRMEVQERLNTNELVSKRIALRGWALFDAYVLDAKLNLVWDSVSVKISILVYVTGLGERVGRERGREGRRERKISPKTI